MRITSILRVSLASTCILLTAFAAGDAPAATQAWRTVQDAKKQLMLSVPSTWLVQSPSGNVTLKATAPASGRALPDSVDVVVHALPSGVRDAQSCEREAEYVTQHLGHINFTTLGTGPAVIGGRPAYTHTYTVTSSSNGSTTTPGRSRVSCWNGSSNWPLTERGC